MYPPTWALELAATATAGWPRIVKPRRTAIARPGRVSDRTGAFVVHDQAEQDAAVAGLHAEQLEPIIQRRVGRAGKVNVSIVRREGRTSFRIAYRVLLAEGATVGLLGLSFKADTDDLRGSPAVYVARRLLDAGHRGRAFDPAVRREAAERAAPGIEVVESTEAVFDDADAVAIATEWPEFVELDLSALRARVARAVIYDGRGLLNGAAVARAGWAYRGVGRREHEPGETA